MRALRVLNPRFSIRDVKFIVDRMNNFSEPFVSEERFENPKQITQMFAGVSEWLYEEVPVDDIADTAEQELYTRSRLWYNSLPKEDRQKVGCLIRNSMPRAY